uniref:Putative secreted protein n=1 Tax=Ixodes ricinus TaxID=34613 RepID=A0A6B0U6J3_IXORI
MECRLSLCLLTAVAECVPHHGHCQVLISTQERSIGLARFCGSLVCDVEGLFLVQQPVLHNVAKLIHQHTKGGGRYLQVGHDDGAKDGR